MLTGVISAYLSKRCFDAHFSHNSECVIVIFLRANESVRLFNNKIIIIHKFLVRVLQSCPAVHYKVSIVQAAILNRNVLSRFLNSVRSEMSLIDGGRSFHASGPAYANARCPRLVLHLGFR